MTGEPDPPKTNPSTSPGGEETELLLSLVSDLDLLTMVVLIGASALVPIPLLDDVAKNYLVRRLIRTLAQREGMSLTAEEIERLTQDPPSGCCLWGCLGNAVVYPIKRLIRKILFFLEIKRAVDQSSIALAKAWLFSLALRRGLWSPGRDLGECDRLREGILTACQSHGVQPLETAFRHGFRGARDLLKEFALRLFRREIANKEELEAAVQQFEEEQGERLASISKKIGDALAVLGEDYLQAFAVEFERQLAAHPEGTVAQEEGGPSAPIT